MHVSEQQRAIGPRSVATPYSVKNSELAQPQQQQPQQNATRQQRRQQRVPLLDGDNTVKLCSQRSNSPTDIVVAINTNTSIASNVVVGPSSITAPGLNSRRPRATSAISELNRSGNTPGHQGGHHSRSRGGSPSVGAPGAPGSQAEEWQSQFFKTKLCPYHLEGRCINGISCRFAHTADELRPLPDLHRTKLCESYVKKEVCRQPGCPFAHNPCELRTSSHSFYKVTLCNFYKKGRCWNGVHCRFAHGTSELQIALPSEEREHLATEASIMTATSAADTAAIGEVVIASPGEGEDTTPQIADSHASQVQRNTTIAKVADIAWKSAPLLSNDRFSDADAVTTSRSPMCGPRLSSGRGRRPSSPLIVVSHERSMDSQFTTEVAAPATVSPSEPRSTSLPVPAAIPSVSGQPADMQTLTLTLMRLLNLPQAEDCNSHTDASAAFCASLDQAPNEAWLSEFLKRLSATKDGGSAVKDFVNDESTSVSQTPLTGGALPSLLEFSDTSAGRTGAPTVTSPAYDLATSPPVQQPHTGPPLPPSTTSTQGSFGLLPSLSNLIFSSTLARSPTAIETVRQVAATAMTHNTEEEVDAALSPSAAKHFFPLSLGQLVGLIDSDEQHLLSPRTSSAAPSRNGYGDGSQHVLASSHSHVAVRSEDRYTGSPAPATATAPLESSLLTAEHPLVIMTPKNNGREGSFDLSMLSSAYSHNATTVQQQSPVKPPPEGHHRTHQQQQHQQLSSAACTVHPDAIMITSPKIATSVTHSAAVQPTKLYSVIN